MILNYEWNRLYVNGTDVELPAVIDKVIIFYDKIIVLLDNNEDRIVDKKLFDKSRNVFGVDLEGSILWQIEKPEMRKDCYANAYINDKHSLKVNSCNGATYDLDPETGKISNPVFTK